MLKLGGETDIGILETHEADLDAHHLVPWIELRTGEYHTFCPSSIYKMYGAITANTLYGFPVVIARDLTVDRIAFQVRTGDTGKSARVGIYNNGTNFHPGSLLVDVGIVSVATASMKEVTIIGDQALTKGVYFVALISDGAPELYVHVAEATPLGIKSDTPTEGYCGWSVGQTYGSLPDPFPTASLIAYIQPRLVLRLKSLD